MNANSLLRRCTPLAVLALLFLSGCASVAVNTTADGPDDRLMLQGHDPVAYFTMNRHVPGRPDLKATHDGVTYRFSSEQHRAAFLKEPARYVPMYGGYCANGLVYAIPLGGNPDMFRVIDGRLYIFGGEGSRRYFEMDLDRNRRLADQYWANEVKDASPFWQSWKRRISRVAHYRTNAELREEWERRQGRK